MVTYPKQHDQCYILCTHIAMFCSNDSCSLPMSPVLSYNLSYDSVTLWSCFDLMTECQFFYLWCANNLRFFWIIGISLKPYNISQDGDKYLRILTARSQKIGTVFNIKVSQAFSFGRPSVNCILILLEFIKISLLLR